MSVNLKRSLNQLQLNGNELQKSWFHSADYFLKTTTYIVDNEEEKW